MRKIMTLLLALAMMVTASMASASAEHGDCPEHLAGDSNFPIVYALWHDGWYVDKSSLNVQRYDPPYYVIAVNVVTVPDAAGGHQAMHNEQTFLIYYNIQQKRMYIAPHTAFRRLHCALQLTVNMSAKPSAGELTLSPAGAFFHLRASRA